MPFGNGFHVLFRYFVNFVSKIYFILKSLFSCVGEFSKIVKSMCSKCRNCCLQCLAFLHWLCCWCPKQAVHTGKRTVTVSTPDQGTVTMHKSQHVVDGQVKGAVQSVCKVPGANNPNGQTEFWSREYGSFD